MTKNVTKRNKTVTKQLRTVNKKADFVASLPSCAWSITETAKKVGISRKQYYEWLQLDADFAADVLAAHEERKDWIETALMKEIKDKNTACIIFACKTQLKDRGYVERSELDMRAQIQVTFDKEDEGL